MNKVLETLTGRKRTLLVIVLLAMFGCLALTSFSRPRYRSTSRVLVSPFTNAILTASFQKRVFGGMPEVQLRHFPNTELIELTAEARTPIEARDRAIEATIRLRNGVQTIYGATCPFFDTAEMPAHPHLVLRDEIWPRMKKLIPWR